jgi:hypothetical protein
VAKVHVLIRGDLPEKAFVSAMEVGLRPILKSMEQPPNPKAETKAHRMATFDVIRQKSAEAIVGEGNHHSWWRGGWKRAR